MAAVTGGFSRRILNTTRLEDVAAYSVVLTIWIIYIGA
jgi:hypothetical protein